MTEDMSTLHSRSPRSLLRWRNPRRKDSGERGGSVLGQGAGGARAGLSGRGRRAFGAAAASRAARGRIPGGEAGHRVLASSWKREEAIPDFPVSGGEPGRGRWPPAQPSGGPGAGPGALLGPRAPASPAASSLPQGGDGGPGTVWGQPAKAGPGPVAPPGLPGAWAALTHIPAPAAGRLLPWPCRVGLAARFPSNSPASQEASWWGASSRHPSGCRPFSPPPWPARLSPASPRALSACAPRPVAPPGEARGGRARPASQARLQRETKAGFKRGGGNPAEEPHAVSSFFLEAASSRTTNMFSKARKPVTHSQQRPLAALGPPARHPSHTPRVNCSEWGGARPAGPAGMAGSRELGGRPAGEPPSARSQAHPRLPAGSCSTPRTSA